MPDDIALRSYRDAIADLESKIATAAQAAQTHRCLIDRLESGEPISDAELDEAAEIARQTATAVATAEDVARAYRPRHDGTPGRQRGPAAAEEGSQCDRCGRMAGTMLGKAGTRETLRLESEPAARDHTALTATFRG
jgi:hypothetical protein